MGFNAEAERKSEEDIDWSDKDLIKCLELGFYDNIQYIVLVNTASPNQISSRDKPNWFSRWVHK